MRSQEERVLGRVGDLGVDDGSGGNVLHPADPVRVRIFREESSLVALLDDDESDA